jgi:hypothetical protein
MAHLAMDISWSVLLPLTVFVKEENALAFYDISRTPSLVIFRFVLYLKWKFSLGIY